jgi:hypothetical protein
MARDQDQDEGSGPESQEPDESSKARARKSRLIGLQATGQHRGGRRSGAWRRHI